MSSDDGIKYELNMKPSEQFLQDEDEHHRNGAVITNHVTISECFI